MLLRRRGVGVRPLSSEPYPKADTSHTLHSSVKAGHTLISHASPSKREKNAPPPRQVPAFSFTPLYLLSLPLPLPRLSSPSLSSLAANQTGDDIMVLQPVRRQGLSERDGRERETHTRTDTPGILTGLLCVRPANLNSLSLTTHSLENPPPPLIYQQPHLSLATVATFERKTTTHSCLSALFLRTQKNKE